jgi:dihydrofolate synthase/folylpolyglutamate synthase
MSKPDLAAWLRRLESLHPVAIELGLERISRVARRLQCDKAGCPVVTVAGTNGKGSTVAVLEALAREAGCRVGCYTSPHMLSFNERIRIDGQCVGDDELLTAFAAVESAREEVSLTYFEFTTLAALWLFARANLELMVLEVGLGGRLDAVNIIDPAVAVITSISLDHQDWLGTTIEAITREKAGILRPGIPVVIADSNPPAVLHELLAENDCQVYLHDETFARGFPETSLRRENVAAAWRVAELLEFGAPVECAPALLEKIQLSGRLQCLSVRERRLVLDVAHNEAAVRNLVGFLEKSSRGRRLAVFAALSDKDIHAMIRSCRGCFDSWYVCGLPGVSRAGPAQDTVAILREEGERVNGVCDNPQEAVDLALNDLDPGETLAVFGSFYTVAEVLSELEQMRSKA